jgi:hypothetical protein
MFSPTANQIPMLCSLTCKSIPYHMRASGLHATMPMRKSSSQLISKPRATEPSKIRIKIHVSIFNKSQILNASTALIPSTLTTHIQILEPGMMYVWAAYGNFRTEQALEPWIQGPKIVGQFVSLESSLIASIPKLWGGETQRWNVAPCKWSSLSVERC